MQQFDLRDTIKLDDAAKLHPTGDGYLAAMPRVARTGIQLYRGSEVGKPHLPIVRVFRSEDEVFKDTSMHTFGHKPITDDHPPVMVNADNWSKYGKGTTDGEVVRDGKFIRVPMMMTDGGLVKKFKDGKAELSVGYTCGIEFKNGVTPEGEAYDAIQTNIRVNHIAVVDAARGGKELRIGDMNDAAGTKVNMSTLANMLTAIQSGKVNKSDLIDTTPDSHDLAMTNDSPYRFMKNGTVYTRAVDAARVVATAAKDVEIISAIDTLLSFTAADSAAPPKKDTPVMNDKTRNVIVDGIGLDLPERDAQIVLRAIDGFEAFKKKATEAEAETTKKVAAKDAEIATLTTTNATKDAEIVTLKSQLDAAKITPAMLDKAITDRAGVAGKAKAVLPTVVIDGKSTSEIMRAVVDAKLGDAAKGWTEDQVTVSFTSLTADAKVDTSTSTVAAAAFADTGHRAPGAVLDNSALYDKRNQDMTEAWRAKPGQA